MRWQSQDSDLGLFNSCLLQGDCELESKVMFQLVLIILKMFLFYFIFERERERYQESTAGEEQRERKRETQNLKQALGSELSAQEPNAGFKLTNCKIMA